MAPIIRVTFLLLIALVIPQSSWASKSTTIPLLLILHDAGETKALIPIIDELLQKNKEVKVLAYETAQTLLKAHFPAELLNKLLIPDIAYEQIRNNEIHVNKLVTGVFSMKQYAFATLFKKRGTQIIALYDSFHMPEPDSIPFKLIKEADVTLVANEYVKNQLDQHHMVKHIRVIGYPSLQEWEKAQQTVNKEQFIQSLKLSSTKPIMVFVGGYGKDYENTFSSFIQQIPSNYDYQIVISIHPKADGKFEKSILKKHPQLQATVAPKNISVATLATISQQIICYRSTSCVYAYLSGYPTIYFDTTPDGYKNWLIEEGQISQTSTVETMMQHLNEKKRTSDSSINRVKPPTHMEVVLDLIAA